MYISIICDYVLALVHIYVCSWIPTVLRVYLRTYTYAYVTQNEKIRLVYTKHIASTCITKELLHEWE